MPKRTNRILHEGGKTYILRDYVSKQRKAKIEQHPQAKEYFKFKRHGGSWFKWYVRTNRHGGGEKGNRYRQSLN